MGNSIEFWRFRQNNAEHSDHNEVTLLVITYCVCPYDVYVWTWAEELTVAVYIYNELRALWASNDTC